MVEPLRASYQRLFEVRVLHHYWLDEGTTDIDRIPDPAARERRLLGYDVRRVLRLSPSTATSAIVAGLRGVLRTTGLGFVAAVPADTVIPLGAVFEFHVALAGPDYANYTAQALARPGVTMPTEPALSPQPTVTVTDPTPDPVTGALRIHRYKANVPVVSNLTGVARGADAAERLYLSREYPSASADDAVEALVAVGAELWQRLGDPPHGQYNVVGPRADLPVFLHQGDVPPIVAPAGSVGAPAFGIELGDDTPPDVAAVIRLAPRRPQDSPFNFAEPDGTPRPRVFELHLQNRRTTWRYHNRGDGSVTSTEVRPLPLTYFGNAGARQKPASASISAELDHQDPPRIVRFFSDVYA